MNMRWFTDDFWLPKDWFTPIIDMELNDGIWEQTIEVKKTSDEILKEKLKSRAWNETDYPWFYKKIKQ